MYQEEIEKIKEKIEKYENKILISSSLINQKFEILIKTLDNLTEIESNKYNFIFFDKMYRITLKMITPLNIIINLSYDNTLQDIPNVKIDRSINLSINEYCNNILIGELLSSTTIEHSIFKLIKYIAEILNLEYILNVNLDDEDTVEMIHNDKKYIILLNKKNENYEILKNITKNFDQEKGMTKDILKYNYIPPATEVTINFLWIFKDDSRKESCTLYPSQQQFDFSDSLKGNDKYNSILEQNYKNKIMDFSVDNYRFDLNNLDYYDNKFKRPIKYKIYVHTKLDYLKEWVKKISETMAKQTNIILWYDSALVNINHIIESRKQFYIINNEMVFEKSKILCLKDIRTLNEFKSLNSMYPELFNKTEINGENIFLPIYFRVDLARIIIAYDQLLHNHDLKYFIYCDTDIKAQNYRWLFNQKLFLDMTGFMFAGQDGRIENGMFIFGSEDNSIKEYISKLVYEKIIKKICEIYKIYIRGECPERDRLNRNKMYTQTFHTKNENINTCLNKIQELVYFLTRKIPDYAIENFKLNKDKNLKKMEKYYFDEKLDYPQLDISDITPPTKFV